MENIIAKLLHDFEHGYMSRRQLIQSLAMTATAAAAASHHRRVKIFICCPFFRRDSNLAGGQRSPPLCGSLACWRPRRQVSYVLAGAPVRTRWAGHPRRTRSERGQSGADGAGILPQAGVSCRRRSGCGGPRAGCRPRARSTAGIGGGG